MAVQLSRYASQANKINDEYGAQSATNAYSKTLSQQRGSRNIADSLRNYQRGEGGRRASLGARGLSGPGVTSGVASNTLQRSLGDFQRNQGRLEDQVQQQQQQHILTQANLDSSRERALADLEQQKQTEIALAALNLKAFAPMLGA